MKKFTANRCACAIYGRCDRTKYYNSLTALTDRSTRCDGLISKKNARPQLLGDHLFFYPNFNYLCM